MATETTNTGATKLSEAKVAELRLKAENNVANAKAHEAIRLYKAAGSEFRNAGELYAQIYKSTRNGEDLKLSRQSYLDAGLSFNAHGSFVADKIEQGIGRGVYTNKDLVDTYESAIECFTEAKDRERADEASRLLTSGAVCGSVSELPMHTRAVSSSVFNINATLETAVKRHIDIRKDPTSKRSIEWALRSLEKTSKELDASIANARKLLGKDVPK